MSKAKKTKYYSMRSFLSYIAHYKFRFALLFLSFVFSNIWLAIIPVFIGKLIASLTVAPIIQSDVTTSVIILIVCSSMHDVSWRVSEFMYLKSMTRMVHEYETIAYQQVIQKPYPYFVDKFTGKVASYVNTLGQELRGFVENILWNYANEIVRLVALTVILTAVNVQTGAIFATGIILMLITGRYTVRNSMKYEKHLADVQSTKNGKIIDSIANFANIKSFHKEVAEIRDIQEEQRKTITAARKSFKWGMVFWGSMSIFIRHLIWPITIVLNVYLFTHGKINIAELTTFLSAILLFSDYIWGIIWSASQFNLKLARIQEAHSYLFGDVNIVRRHFGHQPQRSPRPDFNEYIQLDDIGFAYPDKTDVSVLKDIQLHIKKGEKIGIVGKSGSGKTTLTKLLLGYYPLVEGSIIVDGKQVDTQAISQLLSFVPQDTVLFHRTIEENIAYASDSKPSRDEIIKAATQAHAHEFIKDVDKGYDALVGERGVKLSAGQRQRIAIARAFLDDNPILILDEATSALDSESEILVQEALEALWHNKTVIAIAHRLSTLRNMDRIIVIKDGGIYEQGSHNELMKLCGEYAMLWNHQSGGFMKD